MSRILLILDIRAPCYREYPDTSVRSCRFKSQIANPILLRAACSKEIPAANFREEAVYWTVTVDGAGHTPNRQHDYLLHFLPGGLPPNDAFWSLTMGDSRRRMGGQDNSPL
jgi:hypothetical protein